MQYHGNLVCRGLALGTDVQEFEQLYSVYVG